MPAVEDVVEAMTSAMTRIMKSSGWDLEVVIAFEPMTRTSEVMDGALQELHVMIRAIFILLKDIGVGGWSRKWQFSLTLCCENVLMQVGGWFKKG